MKVQLSRQLDTYGLNASSLKSGILGTCATYLLSTVKPAKIIPIGADSSKTYGRVKNGSVQGALQNLMAIVHDCSSAQVTEFSNRIKSITGNAGIASFIKTFYEILVSKKWHDLDAGTKDKYIDKFIGWLDSTKCIDALELTDTEKSKLRNIDVQVLTDFLLSFLSQDYSRKMYGTDGFAQALTLWHNIIEAIGQNHSPNVAMAWVRGQDSLYANETSAVSASYVMPADEGFSVKASAVKVSAAGEQILVDVGEIDDIISGNVSDTGAKSRRTWPHRNYSSSRGESICPAM